MTMLEFSLSPRLKDSNFQNIEESEYFDSSDSDTFKVTKLFADHAGGWALKSLYTCNQTKTNEATGESFSFDVIAIIRSRASISTTVNRKRLTLNMNCWQTTNQILIFFAVLAINQTYRKIIFASGTLTPCYQFYTSIHVTPTLSCLKKASFVQVTKTILTNWP